MTVQEFERILLKKRIEILKSSHKMFIKMKKINALQRILKAFTEDKTWTN